MTTLVPLAALRGLLRHPLQLALAVLGVALGVAVVAGIDLASESARRSLSRSVEALTGRADHTLVAGPEGLPSAAWTRLRRAYPDLDAAPVVEGRLALPGVRRERVTVLGIDALAEGRLRPWLGALVGVGATADPGAPGVGLTALWTTPRAGLVSRATAERLGLARGAARTLRRGAQTVEARVLALFETEGGARGRALDGLFVCDVAAAQELLGQRGRLTRIDLVLEPEDGAAPRPAELLASLADLLPADARIAPAGEHAGDLARMTEAFHLNLRALALVALVVGVFLVVNTMIFSVVRRRALFATMRTLGVTRGQVFSAVLSEAAAVAVVGTALGLVLGTGLARVLLAQVTRTLGDLYVSTGSAAVELAPAALARAGLTGVLASLFGATLPAWEATRAAPRLALQRSTIETHGRRAAAGLFACGLVALGSAALLLSTESSGVRGAFLGLFLFLLAAGLCAPALAGLGATAVAGPLGRCCGMLGRLAARSVVANLSRTSLAVAALSVALAATIGMGLLVSSFRSTLVAWLDLSLPADIYVAADSEVSSRNTAVLDPRWRALAASIPGVVGTSTYRGVDLPTADGPVFFGVLDMDPRERSGYDWLEGDAADVWPRFDRGECVIVSEAFAYRRGLSAGDPFAFPTPAGEQRLPIAGVYADYASDQGFVLVARQAWERWFDDPTYGSMSVYLEPGAARGRVQAALEAQLGTDETVVVRDQDNLRRATLEVFDRTFAVTEVLRWVATFVAFVGVLAALLSLELERGREFAVLRTQGLEPAGLARLVIGETTLLGLLAGLLALPAGLGVAWILVHVINRRSFGWSLDLQVTPGALLGGLGLALLAALFAGVPAAWRASRARPALALRSE